MDAFADIFHRSLLPENIKDTIEVEKMSKANDPKARQEISEEKERRLRRQRQKAMRMRRRKVLLIRAALAVTAIVLVIVLVVFITGKVRSRSEKAKIDKEMEATQEEVIMETVDTHDILHLSFLLQQEQVQADL